MTPSVRRQKLAGDEVPWQEGSEARFQRFAPEWPLGPWASAAGFGQRDSGQRETVGGAGTQLVTRPQERVRLYAELREEAANEIS